MAIDDYFKQPGSVPFKWEIRPGVPKVQYQQHHQEPSSDHHHNRSLQNQKQHSSNHSRSSPRPQKLRPPPAGFNFQPPLELRIQSVQTVPRTRSLRDRRILAQPEIVSSGCFTTNLVMTRKEKKNKKTSNKITTESESETDYRSDLETLSRWSVSTRKSLSPFRGSPSASSFSSYQSSPRPVSDAEWAGFGLF